MELLSRSLNPFRMSSKKIIKYFKFLAEATDTDVELHNRGDKASLCINLCH